MNGNRKKLETLLAVQSDDLTGRRRDGEHNPLERAQVPEEGGKVVSKCKCLALKSSLACEEMEGSGKSHPVTQQTTAVDGVSHADCTTSPDRFFLLLFSSRGWDGPRKITSRRSPFREIGDDSAKTRNDSKEHR